MQTSTANAVLEEVVSASALSLTTQEVPVVIAPESPVVNREATHSVPDEVCDHQRAESCEYHFSQLVF